MIDIFEIVQEAGHPLGQVNFEWSPITISLPLRRVGHLLVSVQLGKKYRLQSTI